MKRLVICLGLMLLFVGADNAQTKTITGTVIDYTVGNSGKWASISIKIGNKKYSIYIEQVDLPTPKIAGSVTEVGRTVQVFYTKIIPKADGYNDELRATKVVEIRGKINLPQTQKPLNSGGKYETISNLFIMFIAFSTCSECKLRSKCIRQNLAIVLDKV